MPAKIREHLDRSLAFATLEPELRDRLADSFELRTFTVGETVFGEGDAGAELHVVLSGRARVTARDDTGRTVTLATLGPGEIFGERALLTGEPRSATVRAVGDLTVGVLARDRFEAVVGGRKDVADYLNAILLYRGLASFLRRLSLLSSLPPESLSRFATAMKRSSVAAGDYVFRLGEEPDRFYVIIDGHAEVVAGGVGGAGIVNRLGPGDCFGELALLTEGRRTASVRAREALELASLDRGQFAELVREFPAFREQLENLVAFYRSHEGSAPDRGLIAPADNRAEPGAPARPPSGDGPASSPPGPPPADLAAPRHARWLWQYPFVAQSGEADCGAACLAMVVRFHGRRIGIGWLRDLVGSGTGGATMLDLAKAGETLGMVARGIAVSLDGLRSLSPPVILHWQGGHYVVLFDFDGRRAIIGDPAVGIRRVARSEIEDKWSGTALVLEPTEAFAELPQERSPLGRFISRAAPFRVILFESMICSFLLSLFALATPIFLQVVVDEVIVHNNRTLLNAVLAGMLMLAVFAFVAKLLRTYLLEHAGNKIELVLLNDFFRQVLALPMSFFSARQVGDVVARVEENEKIKQMLSGTTVAMVVDVFMVIVYFALMFYYSTSLATLVLLFLPLFVLLSAGSTPIYAALSQRLFEHKARLDSHIVESVSGIQTIKANTAEVQFRWRWEDLFVRYLRTRFNFQITDAVVDAIADLIVIAGTMILLWYGSRLVMNGELSVGQLVAFYSLAGMALAPIDTLASNWNQLVEATISIRRIGDVFDTPPEVAHGDVGKVFPGTVEGRIVFDNVSFAYPGGEHPVLSGVSFEILPGQTIAIVGRSGSGKTTLANLLMNYYRPNEGRIVVDDWDISSVHPRALRENVGVVLQDNFLFSGTVMDNISLGAPERPFSTIVEAATLAAAHDFIMSLPGGYNAQIGERGNRLSGGQRQRLAIARALVKDPPILIFDEATSALDNESEKAIQANLSRIAATRTMIIIAHRLSTVRDADRIVVLDAGELVEQGTHEELMRRRGLYFYLNSQSLEL